MDLEKLKLNPQVYKFSPQFSGQRCNFSTSIDKLKYHLDIESMVRKECSRIILEIIDSQLPQTPTIEYLDLRNSGEIFSKISKLAYRYSRKFCFLDSITSFCIYSSVMKEPTPFFQQEENFEPEGIHNHFSLMGTKFLYFHPYNNNETLVFHDGVEYNLLNPKVLQSGDIYREMYVLENRLEFVATARLINPIRIGLVSSNDSETLRDPDYINWSRIEKLKNLI